MYAEGAHTDRQGVRTGFFNSLAAGWEAANYSPEKRRRLEALMTILDLRPGMSVLDVGCGTGILQPFLRREIGMHGKLIGLDLSPAMLAAACRNFPDSLHLLADAAAIPLPDNYLDRVVCFSAFPHIDDKEAAAREFHRVLKPGGRAFVLHIDGRDKLNHMHDRHEAVRGDHLPCPVGMRKIFGQAGFDETALDEGENHYHFTACKRGN